LSQIKEFFLEIKEYLNIPITTIGNSTITLWSIVYFAIVTFLLIYTTAKLRRWVVYQLLEKSKIDIGVRVAVGTIIRYVVLTIGLIIIFQTLGLDLSSITIIAGALGIGIGFGLQNITNNFVSGIVILFERPIKVGDRIEVGDISGDVISIKMRATTILTNDNISIIVPNSDFIANTVINWSYTDRNVRFNFPVSVSFKEDPQKIKKILMEVAAENSGVLKEPKPDVLFDEYAESSLKFNLRVWTREYTTRPGVLRSQLYYEVFKKFKENGIEIPFPQRDIHIKSDDIKKLTGK
jgi:small-conductance mechanosensitive channel